MSPSKHHKDQKDAANAKLRTAQDVLQRLQWDSASFKVEEIMIGYDDRVKGPLEKQFQDFAPIDQGGDIPLHRIWYFRGPVPTKLEAGEAALAQENSVQSQEQQDPDPSLHLNDSEIKDMILWDRFSRVDKVFGSGRGADSFHISTETTQRVRDAMRLMVEIEQEQRQRREMRDHERCRAAQKRQARKEALEYLAKTQTDKEQTSASNCDLGRSSQPMERYSWHSTFCYEYSKHQDLWECAEPTNDQSKAKAKSEISKRPPSKNKVTIISWNVLFNLHEDESVSEGDQADIDRWQRIVDELGKSNADIVALQEVTPTFLEILESAIWVREHYALSASPSDPTTVTPSGNLILWRKLSFTPVSTWICRDGEKQRTSLAALQSTPDSSKDNTQSIWLIANLHLLADPFQRSAAQARRREIASVVGQLQILESKLCSAKKNLCIPILLGDFNANEQQRELEDGCFSGKSVVGKRPREGFFVDAWDMLSSKQPDGLLEGYTFNPQTNPRAARTRALTTQVLSPKRNDRIYVARQWRCQDPYTDIPIVSRAGHLLCRADPDPPSDHFGLSLTFEYSPEPAKLQPVLLNPSILEQNAFSANVSSSAETLLGIVLDQGEVGGVPFFDRESTLPISHITLLHGFAEFRSSQAKTLALQACSNTVEVFLKQLEGCTGEGLNLTFTPDCLEVLSHESSATLVALPSNANGANAWLRHLYECLIATFRQCHHQESRFEDGWTPHVSLGSFGTPSAARARLVDITTKEDWISQDWIIPVQAITMFERNLMDGKIYAVASVPLQRKPPESKTILARTFLHDSGSSLSRYFAGKCQGLMLEIDRACQSCALAMDGVSVEVVTTGSLALGVGLPDVSDVDAVVQIRQRENSGSVSGPMFFRQLSSHLLSVHPSAKIRTRIAGTGSTCTLNILTIKLWPWAPSIDILICNLSESGLPMDTPSEITMNTIHDVSFLRHVLEQADVHQVGFFAVFQHVLRVVKFWAWKTNIYGASSGYLGGGGFAILVARVLLDGYSSGALVLDGTQDQNIKCQVATDFFFQQTSNWGSIAVTFQPEKNLSNLRKREMKNAVVGSSMCVLAPVSEGNHGRNSTGSTKNATLDAFMWASQQSFQERLEEQSSVTERLQSDYPFALACRIGVSKSSACSQKSGQRPILAEIKAWGSSHVVRILHDLERNDAPFCNGLRLFSAPVKTSDDAFVYFSWFLGAKTYSNDVQDYVKKQSTAWKEDLESGLPEAQFLVQLELMRTNDLRGFC